MPGHEAEALEEASENSAGAERAVGEAVATCPAPSLKFGDDDLVYGPSAKGKLRELQQSSGGKLLSDLEKPPDLDITEFSKQTLDEAAESGRQVHFDLTNMENVEGALAREGPHADKITSQELRHMRDNWDSFRVKPKFYNGGVEVKPPWIR